VIVIFVIVFATTSTPVQGATPADNIVAVQAVIINLPNYSPAVIPTTIIITGNFLLAKVIFSVIDFSPNSKTNICKPHIIQNGTIFI